MTDQETKRSPPFRYQEQRLRLIAADSHTPLITAALVTATLFPKNEFTHPDTYERVQFDLPPDVPAVYVEVARKEGRAALKAMILSGILSEPDDTITDESPQVYEAQITHKQIEERDHTLVVFDVIPATLRLMDETAETGIISVSSDTEEHLTIVLEKIAVWLSSQYDGSGTDSVG